MSRRAVFRLPLLSLAALLSVGPLLAQDASRLDAPRKAAFEALRRQGTVEVLRIDSEGDVRVVSGLLSAAAPAGRTEEAAREFLEHNRVLFGLKSTEQELTLLAHVTDPADFETYKLQQTYRGLPVYLHQIAVHFGTDHRIRAVTADLAPEVELASTAPTLTREQATAAARAAVGIEQPFLERAELVVFADDRTGRDHLAYEVALADWHDEQTVLVDAGDGRALARYSAVAEGPVQGTGTNLFGQKVDPLYVYEGKSFPLPADPKWKEAMEGLKKGAFNLVDTFDPSVGILYGLDGHGTANPAQLTFLYNGTSNFGGLGIHQRMGVSGQQNLETTLQYYKNRFGRSGIDGKGLAVIHFQNWLFPNMPYGAAWHRHSKSLWFSTGGAVPNFNNLVARPSAAALTAVAHELTHGVTASASGLLQENEPGALNESMSEIFVYLVRAAATQSYNNWVLHQDLWSEPPQACDSLVGTKFCRSLAWPRNYLQPDRLGGQYYKPPVNNPDDGNDRGYVHTNMGIPNKVFYLLVAGGRHYGMQVQPLVPGNLKASADAAAGLMYYLNTQSYGPKTDFFMAKTAMITTAVLNPKQQRSAELAWYAVGVDMELVLDVRLDDYTVTEATTGAMQGKRLVYKAYDQITLGGQGKFVIESKASVLFCAPKVVLDKGYEAKKGSTVKIAKIC